MTRISQKSLDRISRGLAPLPTEDEECIALVGYLDALRIKFYTHINNEMYTTSFKQKAKSKKLGVKSWPPDYLIVLPTRLTKLPKNKLIFIEMKIKEGGYLKPQQKAWLEALDLCEGVDAYRADWFQEAKDILNKYFNN